MGIWDSNNNTISEKILIGNDECIVEENCQGSKFSDNGDCTYGQGDGAISGYNLDFLLVFLSLAAIILSKKLRKSKNPIKKLFFTFFFIKFFIEFISFFQMNFH